MVIIQDVNAIVNIVSGLASLMVECEESTFCTGTCSACGHSYWSLCKNEGEYVKCWPFCGKCGHKYTREDIKSDPSVCGVNVTVLWKDNAGVAMFKITKAATEEPAVKRALKRVDAKFVTII